MFTAEKTVFATIVLLIAVAVLTAESLQTSRVASPLFRNCVVVAADDRRGVVRESVMLPFSTNPARWNIRSRYV